jgi:c-di-GMP-binding flagellar brake protein YcgR
MPMINEIGARYPDVLMYCRTVVETGDYVTTGVTTYAEGDLIEVELPEFERFALKEAVKISVYSPVGLLVFRSTVIAVGEGSILVLGSPQIAARFGEVRQHPRIHIALPGFLYADGRAEDAPINITAENISLGGIGFKVFEEFDLSGICRLDLPLNEQLRLACGIEIVRRENRDTHLFFGAKFLELPADLFQSLRAYILRRQVDLYYEHKRTELRRKGQLT